ncbi:PE1-like protein [Mya arenaria]|uniref:PE1-like protein n=1 Tax=Mya arenaria TaxID=6604 RepID=A0ABY7G0J0_MYAAR|nr:PE1-like protein [Mya arenaria]
MMIKIVALSLMVAFVAAGPYREKHYFKNIPNPCINNPSSQVYYPHPSDNSKFIQCDRSGRMYIIQCPENMLYSPLTSTCGTTAKPAPSEGSNIPAVNLVNGNPCTAQALADGHIYFAVPDDSTAFIECDLLGHPNVLHCPNGLIWDQSRLSCRYNFGASGGTGTVPGTVSGGGGSTVAPGTGSLANNCSPENIAANKLFWPHPDPTKYIQCDLWGDLFVNSCPSGLVWNQYYETCASAYVNYAGTGAN